KSVYGAPLSPSAYGSSLRFFARTGLTDKGSNGSIPPVRQVVRERALCALRSPRAAASTDRNPLFAMFCRCLDRCLLRGRERPIRRCRRCAPVSLYVAGVCLNHGMNPETSLASEFEHL